MPPGARFRIERVFRVTGRGPVLSGEVENGFIRTSQDLLLVPPGGSAEDGTSVTVVSATVDRRSLPVVGPGVRADIEIRGVPGNRVGVASIEVGSYLLEP